MLHVPRGDPKDCALVLLNDEVCSICLDPLEARGPSRPLVTTLTCGHGYHTACLSGWERKLRGMRRAARCAICQREYGPPPTPPSRPSSPAIDVDRSDVRIDMGSAAAAVTTRTGAAALGCLVATFLSLLVLWVVLATVAL